MSLAYAKIKENNCTEEDYYRIPENVHGELIEGQIYYQAAPSRIHQEISGFLYTTIYNYIKEKQGACRVYHAPFAVKLFCDKKTIVEPDLSVVCDQNKLTDQGCDGAPDWIIEIISPNNPGNDYVRKLNLYADAGVREYWIVDPMGKTVSVYHLEENTFRAAEFTFEDTVQAYIYDDFSIDFSEVIW